MPSPTVAQLNDRLTAASSIAWAALTDLRGDLPTLLDTLLAEAATINSSAQDDAAARFLQFAAGLLGQPAADLLAWSFYDYAYAAEQKPAASLDEAIRLTVEYFAANNVYVKSRGINFGAASAGGSNVGNGIVQRQTVDERGQEIEAVTLEAKSIECVADARIGNAGTAPAVNRETFQLNGEPLNRYGLDVTGSGLQVLLEVADINSVNFLSDPLFAGATFATAPTAGNPQAPTALGDWTAATIARITASVDDLPRSLPQAGTTAYKLVFGNSGSTADNTITQASANWQSTLPATVPNHAEVWLRRRSSVIGTVTLTLGSQTGTVDATTLVNDTWTRLRLSDGTSSKNWPSVWNQNSAVFSVALSGSGGTGTLEVAFPMLIGMQQIDGSWWSILPGTTPFVRGDVFTATDALDSTDSRVQQLVARLFNRYLPHTADATQVTASGGRTLTYAASGNTITASSGSFVSDGYKVGMLLTSAGTSSNNFAGRSILTVGATTLTVDGAALTDEGPLSATATLNATATIDEPA